MLQIQGLSKIYGGKIPTHAVNEIRLMVQKGEFVGIMGPSGSGKTTLLNLVSTIDSPTSGEILINRENPLTLKKDDLAKFRRRHLGVVFQDLNLIHSLTVLENIILPLALERIPPKEIEEKLRIVAEKLDIANILDKRIYEVSGGEGQRASIARAIIHTPSLLLADEPTGNLDSKSSRTVIQLIEKLNLEEGVTVLMVTHDPVVASYCKRVIFFIDGQLYNEIHQGHNRQTFFQEIIDMLSFLGGHAYGFPPVSTK